MRRDELAASPLVVLGTAVAVAVAVTALVLLVFVDQPDASLDLQQQPSGLEVTRVAGDLRWEQITVRLTDRGGYDHPLAIPEGPVEEGQVLTWDVRPPPGQYLVQVHKGDSELERLLLSF